MALWLLAALGTLVMSAGVLLGLLTRRLVQAGPGDDVITDFGASRPPMPVARTQPAVEPEHVLHKWSAMRRARRQRAEAQPTDGLSHVTHVLWPGKTLDLREADGELTVVRGCLWITRKDDPVDHFLLPGERLVVDRSKQAIGECGSDDEAVLLRWRPRRPSPASVFGAVAGAAQAAFARMQG